MAAPLDAGDPPECPPPSPTSASPPACAPRLDELGIAEPFPVQAATLPDALAGRDVCGKAPTGSGKTIAFGLPLLARVEKAAPRRPKALVLVPTRELASQVQDQLEALCWGTKTEVLAVYGGAGMERQMKALASGVEVVVATPGRLKDLLERGSLRLDDVRHRRHRRGGPHGRHGLPPRGPAPARPAPARPPDDALLGHARRRRRRARSATTRRTPSTTRPISMEKQGEVTHRFWAVSHADRIQVATAIVERSWPAIVFSRTRHGAERLSKQLNKAGVRAEAIHGDRSQSQRERALAAFGRGDVHVLVATDVAARGIHVDGVACVLQFDPPATDKDYVHRAGRTGRAGEPGTVITLVSPEKEKDVRKMQRELRRREPIEAASVATAATILAAAPPKPVDRGDGLDGVSRRERARAEDRPRPSGPRPERKGARKGTGAKTAGERASRPAARRPTRRVGPSRQALLRRSASRRDAPQREPGRNGQDRAVPRPAPVAPAPSPADDPLVQEPPVRAAPPAATHADAR